MAYENHSWECGDKITADLLNHIEEGIEDAGSGGGSCDADSMQIWIPDGMWVTTLQLQLGGNIELAPNAWQQLVLSGTLDGKQIIDVGFKGLSVGGAVGNILMSPPFLTLNNNQDGATLVVSVKNVGSNTVYLNSTNTKANVLVFYMADEEHGQEYYVLEGEAPPQ